MDVRCNRCGTEYEFDDALVSERGTTVKCTNCGHQFKVYPGGGPRGPDRWIVRKASGRELVYTSLKELQRAIAQRQVGPSDLLSRGGVGQMRPLGEIAELEPFFEAHSSKGPVPSTLLGIAPRGEQSGASGIPSGFESTRPSSEHPEQVSHSGAFPFAAPPREEISALSQIGAADEPQTVRRQKRDVVNPQPASPQYPSQQQEPPAQQQEPPAQQQAPAAYAAPSPEAHGAVESMPMSVGSAPAPPPVAPPPPQEDPFRSAYDDSLTDPRYITTPPMRRSAARWVVGLVLLGGLCFLALTVGRKYFEGLNLKRPEAAAPAPEGERAATMLKRGKELMNAGDLDGAKEQLDKASVLSEQNPQVRTALAELEATRADVHWLALKLIPEEDETARAAEKKLLEARVAKVDAATDAAAAAAATTPNDPQVRLARIDARRLDGDLSKARALVSGLGSNTGDPHTAYVLAALDLAEEKPAWETVIDRLRRAAGIEGDLGRARAALVYALASRGKVDSARSELTKMQDAKHPHPLLERLTKFVKKAAPSDEPEQDTEEAEAEAESTKAARDDKSEEQTAAAPARGGPATSTQMDFRRLLEAGAQAKSRGDLSRAEMYYREAREKDPGNIEALAGLADVARARGDAATALRDYNAVLAANPNYLPAIVALADMKWASGEKVAAVGLYKRLIQQSGGGGPYGSRAKARIAEYEVSKGQEGEASSGGPSEPEAPDEPEVPSPSPPREPETPNIDTTDLPGFER